MTAKRGFRRLDDGIDRGPAFTIDVDGLPVEAHGGESVAAVLLAAGRRHGRLTTRLGQPRGPYCAMGVCWECVVVIDGRPDIRACMTLAVPGMRVETQHGRGGRR